MSFAFLNISSNIEAGIYTIKFGGQGCPPYGLISSNDINLAGILLKTKGTN